MGTLSVDKILKTSQGAAEFTLPATDGSAGQAWISDGSGQLSVGEVTAAGIATDAVGSSEIAANAITPAQMANSAFLANRNMVINGAMQIAQRGTTTTTAGFIVDRIESAVSAVDELVCTYSQDSSGADGFANSYKINVDTAESAIAVDEYQRVTYKIEAQDCQDLKYGNAAAESVTLSFYVKSNVTGTYAFCIFGDDGSRLIGGTYAISASATWEKKTLTFAGDTAGTMNDDNGSGLRLCFWLIAGTNFTSGSTNTSWMASVTASVAYGHAVNLGSAVNNYWQITGVQLERGTTATPFESKTYAQELQACLRYFEKESLAQTYMVSNGDNAGFMAYDLNWGVKKRATPTVTFSTWSVYNYITLLGDQSTANSWSVAGTFNSDSANVGASKASHGLGNLFTMRLTNVTLSADAEL